MNTIHQRIPALLITGILAGILLPSCYKKFDANSYRPPFTISGFTAVHEIEPSALVGYWAFEGGVADSVSGSAGTNTKGSFITGFKNNGLSLNVDNKAYATFTPGAAITGLKSFTISFWVNPTFVDADNSGTIDGILGFVNLANTANFWGNLDWFVENGSSKAASTIKIHVTSGTKETWIVLSNYANLFGSWSNHTLTYDASTSNFIYYVNGAKMLTTAAAWTGNIGFTNNGPLIFGAVQFQTTPSYGSAGGAQSWASYLSGTIDEVRIYNKALTGDEVNALVVLQGKGK